MKWVLFAIHRVFNGFILDKAGTGKHRKWHFFYSGFLSIKAGIDLYVSRKTFVKEGYSNISLIRLRSLFGLNGLFKVALTPSRLAIFK